MSWVSLILVFVLLGLLALKYIYVTPLDWGLLNFFPFLPDQNFAEKIQGYIIPFFNTIYRFLKGHPYLWPIWNRIPVFNFKNPITLLTDFVFLSTVGVLIFLLMLGKHLLHRTVEEEIMPSSIVVYGSIGVMNTGRMAIKQVESIAAHLTRISSPAKDQIAHAIAALTKAITETPNLDESKRSEALQQFPVEFATAILSG